MRRNEYVECDCFYVKCDCFGRSPDDHDTSECLVHNDWKGRARKAERELKNLEERISKARGAFDTYVAAIEEAQRGYHNYQEWGDEEWGPIDRARKNLYDILDGTNLQEENKK